MFQHYALSSYALTCALLRVGLGSIDSISTWLGSSVSALLRSSGPKAYAGHAACTRRGVRANVSVSFGSITLRFRSQAQHQGMRRDERLPLGGGGPQSQLSRAAKNITKTKSNRKQRNNKSTNKITKNQLPRASLGSRLAKAGMRACSYQQATKKS